MTLLFVLDGRPAFGACTCCRVDKMSHIASKENDEPNALAGHLHADPW